MSDCTCNPIVRSGWPGSPSQAAAHDQPLGILGTSPYAKNVHLVNLLFVHSVLLNIGTNYCIS